MRVLGTGIYFVSFPLVYLIFFPRPRAAIQSILHMELTTKSMPSAHCEYISLRHGVRPTHMLRAHGIHVWNKWHISYTPHPIHLLISYIYTDCKGK